MALSNGPNLGILVDGGIGEVHYDALMQQWRAMDALVQPRVKSAVINTPPVSPADGDCYVVPSGATGVWSGNTNKIARYSSKQTAWEYYTPKNGWVVHNEATSSFIKYNGTAWVDPIINKADLVDGKVPASQLPSYVDDILEFPDLASFPVTGESGKIYVAIDTGNSYRWSGSTYVKVSQPLEEIPQATIEAGTDSNLFALTARRVRQATAAWWLTASTAFGRTLANITDAHAGRTALGLGTIATQNAASVEVGTLSASGQIYSAANIAAAGEVTGLTVRASIANLITDWNAAVTTGDFMTFEAANAPTPYGWYIGRATAHNTGYVTQEAWLFTADNPVRFRRHSRDGVWSAWVSTGEWTSSGLAVAGSLNASSSVSAPRLVSGYGEHGVPAVTVGDPQYGMYSSGGVTYLRDAGGGTAIRSTDGSRNRLVAADHGTTIFTGAVGAPPVYIGQENDHPYMEINRWTGSGNDYYGSRIMQESGALSARRLAPGTIGNRTVGGYLTLLDANNDLTVHNGKARSAAGFEISDYFYGSGNGVFPGNADGASATGANLNIRSWLGIGFGPSISGQAVPQGENALWMDVRNGTLTGRSWAMFDRFFNADGSVGADQANAKNHFTQQNAGAATGVSTGWLSAAFGKADGGRLAFGQYGGKSYLVGHNGDLSGWDTVNIRGDELHYYVSYGDTPSIRMGSAGIDSLGSIKASSSSIGVQLMSGSEAKAFHLATLPASTEGTYDHLRIVGTSGAWESGSKSRFELIIGNRAGLTVRYLEGQLDANRNISLHPLANGDVEVYATLVNFSTMELQMYGCNCTVNQPVVEQSASTAATWSAADAYPRRQSRYDTERELITVNVDGTGGQELWNRSAGANAYVGTRLRNDVNGDSGVFRLSSSNLGYAGPNSTMLWSGGGKIAIWNQGDDAIEFATSDVNRMTLDAAGVLAIASLPANDFPNDAAAAADGIPIGGLYHTSGTVKVRLS